MRQPTHVTDSATLPNWCHGTRSPAIERAAAHAQVAHTAGLHVRVGKKGGGELPDGLCLSSNVIAGVGQRFLHRIGLSRLACTLLLRPKHRLVANVSDSLSVRTLG